MTKRKKNSRVKGYRHDEKRKNNPRIGMVSYEPKVDEPKTKHYAYDPHLSPQLVWAGKPGVKTIEVESKIWRQVATFDTTMGQEAQISAQEKVGGKASTFNMAINC